MQDAWLPAPTAVIDPRVLRPGPQFKALANAVDLLKEAGHLRVPPDVYDLAALHAFPS